MPVLKHAKKKLRQDKNRTAANKRIKSTYKELVKKATASPSKEALSAAFKAIDKAAKANLIHDNKAGHLKSALSKVASGGKKEAPVATAKKAPAKKTVASTAKSRSTSSGKKTAKKSSK